jgi:hypothetical protein
MRSHLPETIPNSNHPWPYDITLKENKRKKETRIQILITQCQYDITLKRKKRASSFCVFQLKSTEFSLDV